MSKRTAKLLLEDILDSSERTLKYTENMTFDEFQQDIKTVYAVVRNFEIIGEASNLLPDELKE